jgi:hypothetical protein
MVSTGGSVMLNTQMIAAAVERKLATLPDADTIQLMASNEPDWCAPENWHKLPGPLDFELGAANSTMPFCVCISVSF